MDLILNKDFSPLSKKDFDFFKEKNPESFSFEDEELRMLFEGWVDEFKKNNASQNHTFKNGDTEYYVRVSFLYDGMKKRGYLLEIAKEAINHPVPAPVETNI